MDYHVFWKNWSVKELQDSFETNDLVLLYGESHFSVGVVVVSPVSSKSSFEVIGTTSKHYTMDWNPTTKTIIITKKQEINTNN